jgi:hypothetical protein
MIITWTYGAINQDAGQFGLQSWNWSVTEAQILGFGRIEYTMPRSQLGYTLERSQLAYAMPNQRLEYTGEVP